MSSGAKVSGRCDAHLDAGPAIVVVAGGDHGDAFDAELELREIGHGRQRQADVVDLGAAGEQAGDQRSFDRGRVGAVVVADDDAQPARRAARISVGKAEADGFEPEQVDLLGKRQRASYSRNPVALTKGRRSNSAVLGTRSWRGFGNIHSTLGDFACHKRFFYVDQQAGTRLGSAPGMAVGISMGKPVEMQASCNRKDEACTSERGLLRAVIPVRHWPSRAASRMTSPP